MVVELNKQLYQAVRFLFLRIEEIAKTKNEVFISLVGGRSVLIFYDFIVKYSDLLNYNLWKKVRFCFGDERLVSLSDDNSNYKLVNKILFSPLIVKGLLEKYQIFEIDVYDPNYYSNLISNVKEIDIAILASGEDGHTCSLFPMHPALFESRKSYLLIEDSPKPPARRLTISKKFIEDANSVIIFFIGEAKSDAYEAYLDDKIGYEKCPIKLGLIPKNRFTVVHLK